MDALSYAFYDALFQSFIQTDTVYKNVAALDLEQNAALLHAARNCNTKGFQLLFSVSLNKKGLFYSFTKKLNDREYSDSCYSFKEVPKMDMKYLRIDKININDIEYDDDLQVDARSLEKIVHPAHCRLC
uniref:Ribonucleoside-diphosphate reductase n=1 Tax=Steinernema glaseri TaxID=37863 RepID=A0A1I8ATC5_9BILA